MLAAVKFFLGQDEAADNSDDEGDEEGVKAVNPTKAEIYNASKKASSTSLPAACQMEPEERSLETFAAQPLLTRFFSIEACCGAW